MKRGIGSLERSEDAVADDFVDVAAVVVDDPGSRFEDPIQFGDDFAGVCVSAYLVKPFTSMNINAT